MKIQVEMTDDEFLEFKNWQKEKDCYNKELAKSYDSFEFLNKNVLWALETDPKKPGKVKIADQEHAAELVEMAEEFFR